MMNMSISVTYSNKLRRLLWVFLPQLLLSVMAHSQGANNTWVFSHYLGLNFNNTPPSVFVQGNLGSSTGEACASISDESGNLLFYTNGSRVWNAAHTAMPNGSNLTGLGNAATLSTSQGAVIVPFPGNDHKYYLFSIVENEMPERGRLYYSVVDMDLNGGLGDVVVGAKGILIDTGMAEKMAAVEGNNCNVWLVVRTLHERVNAYEISATGLNTTPVVSLVGNPVSMLDNYTGQFAFSPDRRSLAETSVRLPAVVAADGLWLHDFDPATGIVSNHRQLLSGKAAYGICFSPNNSRLYVQSDSLYQYNLLAGNTPSVIASKTALRSYSGLSAIQKGPDNKLYCKYFTLAGAPVYSIGCIQNPDQLGPACSFVSQSILLPGSFGPGLPGGIANRLVPKDTFGSHTYDSLNCFGVPPLTLSAVVGTGYNYEWDNGATGQQRTVTMGAIYRVGYHLSPCEYRIDSFTIWSPTPVAPVVQVAAACTGTATGKAWMTTGGNTVGYTLKWSSASDTTTLSVSDSLLPVAAGNYKVRITTTSGCDTTLYFTIPEEAYLASFTVSDTLICAGEEVLFGNTSDNYFTEYLWLLGDGNTSTEAEEFSHTYAIPGVYEVKLTASGQTCRDTFIKHITVDAPAEGIGFTKDKDRICLGETVQFTPLHDSTATGFHWLFGDGHSRTEAKPGITRHAFDTYGKMTIRLTSHFRACNSSSKEDSLWVYPLPYVDLGPDSVICLDGKPLLLTNLQPHHEGDQYLWNNGATERSIRIVHHGEYSLSVTNKEGCSTVEQVTVRKDCYLDIPNAFTPNGDGINDHFFPRQLLSKSITSFRMQVFNRWGQVVFETRRRDGRGWDGKFNGKDQPGGVYIYLIEAGIAGSIDEKYQGNVTLIR
jgi:gliding motility-associated-like protein